MTSAKEIVLQSLIDRELVLDERDGSRWLTKEKITGFGGKTAEELIIDGCSDVVLKYIERIVDGGFA